MNEVIKSAFKASCNVRDPRIPAPASQVELDFKNAGTRLTLMKKKLSQVGSNHRPSG